MPLWGAEESWMRTRAARSELLAEGWCDVGARRGDRELAGQVEEDGAVTWVQWWKRERKGGTPVALQKSDEGRERATRSLAASFRINFVLFFILFLSSSPDPSPKLFPEASTRFRAQTFESDAPKYKKTHTGARCREKRGDLSSS